MKSKTLDRYPYRRNRSEVSRYPLFPEGLHRPTEIINQKRFSQSNRELWRRLGSQGCLMGADSVDYYRFSIIICRMGTKTIFSMRVITQISLLKTLPPWNIKSNSKSIRTLWFGIHHHPSDSLQDPTQNRMWSQLEPKAPSKHLISNSLSDNHQWKEAKLSDPPAKTKLEGTKEITISRGFPQKRKRRRPPPSLSTTILMVWVLTSISFRCSREMF